MNGDIYIKSRNPQVGGTFFAQKNITFFIDYGNFVIFYMWLQCGGIFCCPFCKIFGKNVRFFRHPNVIHASSTYVGVDKYKNLHKKDPN